MIAKQLHHPGCFSGKIWELVSLLLLYGFISSRGREKISKNTYLSLRGVGGCFFFWIKLI